MIQDKYTYHFPTHIRFGIGVIGELGGHLRENGVNKALIVTDRNCEALHFFKEIVDGLTESGLEVAVFSDVHKNPVKSDVEKGTEAFHANGCDGVVGLGGGVALDVARAVALKAYHKEDLFAYEEAVGGDKKIVEPIPYFVAVPTTSGTGSEVGRSTVIADDNTRRKKILFSPRLMAKAVFADPELTLKLPPQVTAATGMDALTHHIEALFSRGFHPICDGIAMEGIRLAWNHLEAATIKPTVDARSAMMASSLMGAVAFQKGLGIVHSLAHSLSTMHDTHHGLANAVMLPYGLSFNASHCPERMQRLKEVMGTDDPVQAIRSLTERLSLPSKLSDIGVREQDLDGLTALAVEDVCHQCNPVPVTSHDFRRLYQEAL